MREWFQCKKCRQIVHQSLLTVRGCPFCGHGDLFKVILKPRDVSPIYTYYSMSGVLEESEGENVPN